MSRNYIVLIIIILIGFSLRTIYLDRSMRLDEATTVFAYASKSLPSVVADYSAPNNHIFHTIFVHFVYHNIDRSPMFVRLPALIAGILLMPLSYVVVSRIYSNRAAHWMMALVAVSPILIDFSINARGYTMLTAIMLLLLYLAHYIHNKQHTGLWLLFGVLSALGFFTIPIMLYPMGVIALYLLYMVWVNNQGEERATLLKNYVVIMLFGAVLTVVLYTPAIYFNGVDALINNVNVQPMPASEFYTELPSLFIGIGEFIFWGLPSWLVVSLVAFALVGIGAVARHNRSVLVIALAVVGWTLPILLLQRVIPFPRTWVYLVVLVLMFSAIGLAFLWTNYLNQFSEAGIAVLFSIGMMVLIVQSQIIPQSEFTLVAHDSEEAAFFINGIITPNDILLTRHPSNYTLFYYSLIHDLPIATGFETDSQLDDTPRYFYTFYHFAWEARVLSETYAIEIGNAEVFHQFEQSTLLRYEVGSATD